MHIENTLCDTLLGNSVSCGWPLRDAMKRISNEDVGVAVILRIANDSESLCHQLEDLNASKKQRLETDSNDSPVNRWTLGVGGQILSDLGVKQMRLLSAPQVFHGLGGFGLEIVEYIDGKQK